MRPEAFSQERGAGGGYLALPAPRIIGVPRRHTTPQREERKEKTETKEPKELPIRQTGAGSNVKRIATRTDSSDPLDDNLRFLLKEYGYMESRDHTKTGDKRLQRQLTALWTAIVVLGLGLSATVTWILITNASAPEVLTAERLDIV